MTSNVKYVRTQIVPIATCAVFTFYERVHGHFVAVLGGLELDIDVGERLGGPQVVPDGRHASTQRRVLVVAT